LGGGGGRRGILSAFIVLLPLSDTSEYVSRYIISIFLDRIDEAIFDMLIT
jgi:hypothetical protein